MQYVIVQVAGAWILDHAVKLLACETVTQPDLTSV